jgi:hypothetical protein
MNELVENSASNLDLVWSVRSIASVIRRSERQTYNLLETGRLSHQPGKSAAAGARPAPPSNDFLRRSECAARAAMANGPGARSSRS